MDLIGKKVAFMLCNAIYNIGKITNVEFNDTNELVFDIKTEEGDTFIGARVSDLLNIYKD